MRCRRGPERRVGVGDGVMFANELHVVGRPDAMLHRVRSWGALGT